MPDHAKLSPCPSCGGKPGPFAEVDPKSGQWCILCFPGDQLFFPLKKVSVHG